VPTTIKDSLERHAKDLDDTRERVPSGFVVGGTFDGHTATGGIAYNRSWKNGWGATAYAKAWWRDVSVTPVNEPGKGGVIGGEVRYDRK